MTDTLSPELSRPDAPSQDCSLDRLVQELAKRLTPDALKEDGATAKVTALLREYAKCEDSWRQYARFDETTYSRNLVWRSDDFELLLLCWNHGQESPIHDHAGQHCWMAVLEGQLEEVHYTEEDGGIRQGRVKAFDAPGVAYIHDDIALHLIRPTQGGRGVSLHLYSSPIDECRIFCPDTGEASGVAVGYHSVRGTDCGGTDPGLIRRAW